MGLLDMIAPQDEEQRQRNLAFFQSLAQAGAPSATPNSWALGIANGFGNANKAGLDYQRLTQQKQLHDLQIQQATAQMKDADIARQRRTQLQSLLSGMNSSPAQNPLTAANADSGMIGAAMRGGDAFSPETMDGISQSNAMIPAQSPQQQSAAWQRYQQIGDMLSSKGFAEEAKPYYDMADKWKPKYKTDNLRDSKTGRTLLIGDDGSIQDSGVTAAEKAHFGDTGGAIVAFDPYTGKPMAGSGQAKTMSPGEIASNRVAQGNLSLSQQQFAFQKEQANKPQFSAEAGGWVFRPDANSPTGRVVAPVGLTGKPPTESQGKAALFGSRAAESDKILRSLDGKYSVPGLAAKQSAENTWAVGGALGVAGNAILSKEAQMVDQAQRDFLNAVLRNESGAVIGIDEFINGAKQYFAQPGDSPEVIAQKAANRQMAIAGLSNMAGGKMISPQANERYTGIDPKQRTTNAPRSKFFNVGGKQMTGQLGADGNYYVTQNGKLYRIEE